MWRTPCGTRVLSGAEARLFRVGLADLVETIEAFPDASDTGVRAFDQLQTEQKLALLAHVAAALLMEVVSPPPLAAVFEAAVAAVYCRIKEELRWNAIRDSHGFKQLLLDCLTELGELDDPSNFGSGDWDVWDALVRAMRDRVLWNRDWAMESEIADLPPGLAKAAKRVMGIPEEYYTAIAPDPSDAELAAARATLAVLAFSEMDLGSVRNRTDIQTTILMLMSMAMMLYARVVGG